jgi:hypothetical protein
LPGISTVNPDLTHPLSRGQSSYPHNVHLKPSFTPFSIPLGSIAFDSN